MTGLQHDSAHPRRRTTRSCPHSHFDSLRKTQMHMLRGEVKISNVGAGTHACAPCTMLSSKNNEDLNGFRGLATSCCDPCEVQFPHAAFS
eukprot:175179-Amphidinium_carterae.1